MNNLLLSFDFGLTNIGVAVGQKITRTAYPLTVVKARGGIPNWKKIEHLLKEWSVWHVIVGLPINMDCTNQLLTKKTKRFANCIQKRFGVQVDLHDERLSTAEARTLLFEKGGYKLLTKNNIDSFSAAIILESWLENSCPDSFTYKK